MNRFRMNQSNSKRTVTATLALALSGAAALMACEANVNDPSQTAVNEPTPAVESVASSSEAVTFTQDFFDDFTGTSLNSSNWQPQVLWVNNELQCYDNNYNEGGQHKTLEVSNGTLKLRVIDSGVVSDCENFDKYGNKHGNTRYKGARIASKNRQEFSLGKWTARLRMYTWTYSNTTGQPSGLAGMFPAWWILGYRNNEAPVQESNENVCWPLIGSGEIDILEHYGNNGQNQWAARGIKNLGSCNNGDWSTYQKNLSSDLSNFHEYQVENTGNDLIYRVDNGEVGRNSGIGGNYPEKFFAILNYALNATMNSAYKEYAMEIDWVKHESAQQTNCNGTVCCATSCVNGSGAYQCGGTGCGSLPGGANVCCTTQIQSLGISCNGNTTHAPCTQP